MRHSMITVPMLLLANAAFSSQDASSGEMPPPQKATPAAQPAADAAFEQFFGPQRDWPRYRGPQGNGVCTEKGLPTKWDGKTGEGVVWSTDIPLGVYPQYPYASPIVFKDKVFISLGHIIPAEHKVACFSKQDGKMLWMTNIKAVSGALNTTSEHLEEHSYSCATPCTDGERVYVVFGSGVVVALDYAGKVIWRNEIIEVLDLPGGEDPRGALNGSMCCSPVLYKDHVIVDSEVGSVAFDRKTGEVRYRERRNGGGHDCHPSPVPALIKGAPWLLNKACGKLCGVNPENGKMVWFINNLGGGFDSLGVRDGILFSEAGGVWELDAFANVSGDITKDAGKWKLDPKCVGGLGTPVISNGCINYLVSRKNNAYTALLCIEAATGQLLYEEKVDVGPNPFWTASPFATADGLIYFASSDKTLVVKAGPKFEVVAINDLHDGVNISLNSAAVSEGKIFFQGFRKVWCIGKK